VKEVDINQFCLVLYPQLKHITIIVAAFLFQKKLKSKLGRKLRFRQLGLWFWYHKTIKMS
jgi:hypothetical protein